jgi:soluble lytic murein transglycosylase-like protein
MQVLLIVARLDLGYAGDYYLLFDPAINIDLGTKLLARQLKRYGGDIRKAVSAYNAGHYTESNSKSYVEPVLKYYNQYKMENEK